MKNIILSSLFIFQGMMAQETISLPETILHQNIPQAKVVDYLKVGRTIKFDGKEYRLVWSSNDGKGYYKQEYRIKKENGEEGFVRLILVEFKEGEVSSDIIIKAKIEELNEQRKQKSVVNYKVHKQGNEQIIDFNTKRNAPNNPKQMLVSERNLYRYIPLISQKNKRKGTLLFAIRDRAYSPAEIEKMHTEMKKNRELLLEKVKTAKILKVK